MISANVARYPHKELKRRRQMSDDNVQHGIDDDPKNDAEKGAALGGVGGAVVGGIAGSAAGPVGTVVGAVVGGAAGAAGSGAAVGAVDAVDNDNTVTGVGDGATRDAGDQATDLTAGRRVDGTV
jgi:phage tail tape-measure protein